MSRNKPTCPVCAGSEFSQHVEARTFQPVQGEPIPYMAEYTRCERCGEEFFTRQQSRAASRAIVGVERQRLGRLMPSEIRTLRTGYGATQEQMERVFNLGKKTWLRWENGLVCQSRAADQLLREVRDSPAMFRRLAEAAGVELPVPMAQHHWANVSEHLINENVVVWASTAVPIPKTPGPIPPPEDEYRTVDWQELFGAAVLTETTTGARMDQTNGSASPELLLAAP